jgi:hypothetical protein
MQLAKINPIVTYLMEYRKANVHQAIAILKDIQEDLKKNMHPEDVLEKHHVDDYHLIFNILDPVFRLEKDSWGWVYYSPELKSTVQWWFGEWLIDKGRTDAVMEKNIEVEIKTLKGVMILAVTEAGDVYTKIDGLWYKVDHSSQESQFLIFWRKLPTQFKGLPIGTVWDGKFKEYHEGKNPCWSAITRETEDGVIFVQH